MNKKNLFFALGTVILLAAVFGGYYSIFRQERAAKEVLKNNCDPALGDCLDKTVQKEASDNSLEQKDETLRSEQKSEEEIVSPGSDKDTAKDDVEVDQISEENKKKFENNEDDEDGETDDNVTVEVEADDE